MSNQRSAQQQVHDVNTESVAATRRILALAEESRTAGVDTMNELDRQGEALNRAEKGLDQINQDMNQAEENLDELEKCCGLCLCPWNKKVRTNNYNDINKKSGKSKKKSTSAAYSSENVTTQPGKEDLFRRVLQVGIEI